MRNLTRRTAVLAGAVAVTVGTWAGVTAAEPPPHSVGGSWTSAPAASRCSPGTAPGVGFYNGKVCIGTTRVRGGFAMIDPARPGLSCGLLKNPDFGTAGGGPGARFTQTGSTWGNGKPGNLKTACVDAMYAAGEMWDMLRDWFGRNGFDGHGHAAAIGVGLKYNGAFFFPEDEETGTPRYVALGRVCTPYEIEPFTDSCQHPDPLGRQRTSMDVVAHEFGHLVFATTPGGASVENFETRALNEGASDIWSQLTIAFADNPLVPLTFTRGSQFGEPFRIMYQPSLAGGADCWSKNLQEVTEGDVYAALGPFTHWFYLLAEGTAPVGHPASPTCDGSTLSGLGIRLAGKIFYNGLLLKTPDWEYRDARRATLTAAKRLFPGSCTVFDKVKAAWNAVSVPAGRGEPACTTRKGVAVTG
jgi:hypothetical protein